MSCLKEARRSAHQFPLAQPTTTRVPTAARGPRTPLRERGVRRVTPDCSKLPWFLAIRKAPQHEPKPITNERQNRDATFGRATFNRHREIMPSAVSSAKFPGIPCYAGERRVIVPTVRLT